MDLFLPRDKSSLTCTMGNLYVNQGWECFTLEDMARKEKIKGETAIPAGRYRITLEDSPRFGPDTLTVNDVPGFTNIRIHAGNTDADTEGCPLVGWRRGDEEIYESRAALAQLKTKVKAAIDSGDEVWITIENHPDEVL